MLCRRPVRSVLPRRALGRGCVVRCDARGAPLLHAGGDGSFVELALDTAVSTTSDAAHWLVEKAPRCRVMGGVPGSSRAACVVLRSLGSLRYLCMPADSSPSKHAVPPPLPAGPSLPRCCADRRRNSPRLSTSSRNAADPTTHFLTLRTSDGLWMLQPRTAPGFLVEGRPGGEVKVHRLQSAATCVQWAAGLGGAADALSVPRWCQWRLDPPDAGDTNALKVSAPLRSDGTVPAGLPQLQAVFLSIPTLAVTGGHGHNDDDEGQGARLYLSGPEDGGPARIAQRRAGGTQLELWRIEPGPGGHWRLRSMQWGGLLAADDRAQIATLCRASGEDGAMVDWELLRARRTGKPPLWLLRSPGLFHATTPDDISGATTREGAPAVLRRAQRRGCMWEVVPDTTDGAGLAVEVRHRLERLDAHGRRARGLRPHSGSQMAAERMHHMRTEIRRAAAPSLLPAQQREAAALRPGLLRGLLEEETEELARFRRANRPPLVRPATAPCGSGAAARALRARAGVCGRVVNRPSNLPPHGAWALPVTAAVAAAKADAEEEQALLRRLADLDDRAARRRPVPSCTITGGDEPPATPPKDAEAVATAEAAEEVAATAAAEAAAAAQAAEAAEADEAVISALKKRLRRLRSLTAPRTVCAAP